MKPVLRNAFVVWLLLLAARAGIAQPVPNEAHFNQFSIREGLPTDNALQIAEDNQGFIWVATETGLACFDGVDFQTYLKGDDPVYSLPSNAIVDMKKLPNGKIVIATSNGPCLLDPLARSFKRLKLPAAPELETRENYLLSACITADGRVLMGSEAGFALLDQELNLLFQHHAFRPEDLGKVDMGFGQHLLPLANGDVLIKGWQGLWRFVSKKNLVEKEDATPYGGDFEVVHTIGKQNWMAGYFFHPDTLWVRNLGNGRQATSLLPKAIKDEIHWRSQMAFANDTLLGISSHYEGFRTAVLDTVAMQLRISEREIFPNTHAHDFLYDSQGRWWLATETGLIGLSANKSKFKFSPLKLPNPTNDQSLIFSSIVKVNGQFFAGTSYHGAWLLDENLVPTEPLPLPNNPLDISWLYNHEPGILDICSRKGWVRVKLPPKNGQAPLKPELVGPANYVYSQFKDSRGTIWTGYHSGLLKYETATGKSTYFEANQDGNPFRFLGCRSICETDSGYVWLCGPSGLTRWNPFEQRFDRFYENPPGVPTSEAFPKIVLSDGGEALMVVEQLNGIWRWEGDDRPATQLFDGSNELNYITHIKPDKTPHRYWVANTNGIALIDTETKRYRLFSSLDGMPDNTTDIRPFLDLDTDTMYLGHHGGIVRFKRTDLDFVKDKLSIYITEIRQPTTGRRLQHVQGLQLSQPDNSLSISFSSPDMELGRLIKYAYRLNDGNWIDLGKSKTVQLLNLSPGEYRFEIKSFMPDGAASEPVALDFEVKPLFYQTWWFMVAVVAAGLLAVYAYFRWRLAQLRKMEAMRQAIAADLHDEVGASLTSIQILSQLASHPDAARSAEALGKLPEQVRHTSASLREIVWNINPKNDDLNLLVGQLMRHAGEVFEKLDIQYTLHADEFAEGAMLDPTARQHLTRIFKEALNNLAKHSQAANASVVFKNEQHSLVMAIADNGKGFDPATVRRGNGLDNMAKRAAAVGGILKFKSQPGAGTETTLSLPVKQQRRWGWFL